MNAIDKSRRWLARLIGMPNGNFAYVRSLESEVVRLRAENRALLNSILGIAGMKPLPPAPLPSFTTQPAPAGHSESSMQPRAADRPLATTASSDPSMAVAGEPSRRQSETRDDSSISADAPPMLRTPPHRRRSWHQINRLLEFQSAAKKSNE